MGRQREVTIWLSNPLWGRDPRTEELFQSNRHIVTADQVVQDAERTILVDINGEVLLDFPTEAIEKIRWAPDLLAKSPIDSTPFEAKDETGFHVGSKEWRNYIATTSPRAYEEWTEEEDDQLRQESAQNLKHAQMAINHQRRRGAIQSRLRKLGLNKD